MVELRHACVFLYKLVTSKIVDRWYQRHYTICSRDFVEARTNHWNKQNNLFRYDKHFQMVDSDSQSLHVFTDKIFVYIKYYQYDL